MTNRTISILAGAALALATVAGLAAAARAGEASYRLDPAASRFRIDVRKAGLFSSLGHAHTVTNSAGALSGEVRYDPAAPAAGSVAFDVRAGELYVADPDADPGDRAQVQANMMQKVLEVERFPTISFRSTSVTAIEGRASELRVGGELTLHGATRPIVLDVHLGRAADGTLVASGETEIKQTDFGIEPFSALLGTIAVADEVGVAFELRAKP